jgi:hypothetical protein
MDLFTTTAWQINEKLRWKRKAETIRVTRWLITGFIRHTRQCIGEDARLQPVGTALLTFKKHLERILQRWTPTHSNARM